MTNSNSFTAPKEQVKLFLEDLKSILGSKNCELDILPKKSTESSSDPYTTENTLLDLDYDTEDVKQELLNLTISDYIETMKDNRDENKPFFWVFEKIIQSKEVYIKVKVRDKNKQKVFCVSFYYARYQLKNCPFQL